MRTRRQQTHSFALTAVLLLILAMLESTSPVSASTDALTGNDLLNRLTDPMAATRSLPEGARVVQHSSHEREGGNRDWGVWSRDTGRPPTYVRSEPGGMVLLDERHPGCLTRMWFTAGAFTGDVTELGRIQLFFDGETQPRFDEPAEAFFAGEVEGFPYPLTGDANSSSGGFYSYVPFCFARSLKVRLTQVPDDEQIWYQLTELALPHGSTVRSYQPETLRTNAAAHALGDPARPPQGDPVLREGVIGPGDQLRIARRRGAGSIRYLRFTVTPFLPETLSELRLRVTANGATKPQLEVPLDVLFGDGLSVRPIRSLAFGMDPATGTGYFSLPIPFHSGVSVSLTARPQRAELSSRTPATVRAQAWFGPPMPSAGTLHGRRTREVSTRGTDFTALRAAGSGRIAAWVLDLKGPPGSNLGPLQFMLEGDERVHVDGSPSPSIYGTGLEDAFNGGFYYNRGAFSLPTHGAGLFLANEGTRAARSQYRVFGGDGFLWQNGIDFGMEHGGGDEKNGQLTASTAFWYAKPTALKHTDVLDPANRDSAKAHRMRGDTERRRLTAYFEGDRDGNSADSTEPLLFGGTAYPAPPPSKSDEAVTASGVAFTTPMSFDLAIDRENCGVVLRRLLDAKTKSQVEVFVDGQHIGPWRVTEANPAKRWRADDFPLHSQHTAGKHRIRVTLAPSGQTAGTAYRIQALSRSGECGRGQGKPADSH